MRTVDNVSEKNIPNIYHSQVLKGTAEEAFFFNVGRKENLIPTQREWECLDNLEKMTTWKS